MEAETPRFGLPHIFVSQAQKEITHNEALVRIDALLHPVVEASLANPPQPAATDAGKCWLIAAGATGAWAGKSGQIACWIGAGWRYIVPREGLSMRFLPYQSQARFTGGIWQFAVQIPDASGGSIIDVEARQLLASLLAELRVIGVLRA
jgi:hypothetical protein